MGNCLITQLKESVQNDSLMKLGEFDIKVTVSDASSSIFFGANSLDNVYARIFSGPSGATFVEDGTQIDYGTNVHIENNMQFHLIAGEYIIRISNYYKLSYLSTDSSTNSMILIIDVDKYYETLQAYKGYIQGDASKLYIPNMHRLQTDITSDPDLKNGFYGNIENAINSNGIIDIIIQSANIDCNISNLNNISNCERFVFDGAGNITGNITSILGYGEINDIQLNVTNISGSTSDFLNNGELVLPKLKTLLLYSCPNFTINESDVTTLRNLGVNVFV